MNYSIKDFFSFSFQNVDQNSTGNKQKRGKERIISNKVCSVADFHVYKSWLFNDGARKYLK